MIIGGTGGLGRSIARRLVNRGAGHVVLLSRRGNMTPELAELVDDARVLGSFIHVRACDVASQRDVSDLVVDLNRTLPAIRGVIHAAMVLRVSLAELIWFGRAN